MSRVRVRIYENRLDKLINDPDGSVGKYLSDKGDQIRFIARSRVGIRTGNLKATIHKRHLRDPRGQYLLIGNDAPYAYYHHEGTRPRTISPVTGKTLRFVSRGQVVFAHEVMHKGNKPNKYLLDALEQVL
jgi:hypothetical protein